MIRPLLLILALSGTAEAHHCGPRDAMLSKAKQDFGEVPIAKAPLGPPEKKAAVELLLSADGSWTILLTGQTDLGLVSCINMTGRGWTQTAPVPLPGDPA